MESKTIAPILVLSKSTETTLARMASDIGDLPMRMNQAIIEAGRNITGPQIWIYHSADGTPDRPITIQVTFPIDQPFEAPSEFECIELPPFNCVSSFNNGPWANVGAIYHNLMQQAKNLERPTTFTSREIYVVCDFENQENCITEVQLGIV